MIQAFEYMNVHGYQVKIPGQEELHMLLSAYTTAVFEPIIHGYPQEKMEH